MKPRWLGPYKDQEGVGEMAVLDTQSENGHCAKKKKTLSINVD